MSKFTTWSILIPGLSIPPDGLFWRTEMDQAVQIIGLTIMCLGLAGFTVSVIGIIRWYAQQPGQSGANDDASR